MFFNLFLSILFAGSVGVLWRRISEKIPELIAIPDEVIVARLHEDSARVRIFLLHARTFWREPRYRESFWRFCEKICYRIHIIFLRMDNTLVILAKKARGYAGVASAEGNGNEEIASEEKKGMAYEIVAASPRAAEEPPRIDIYRNETRPRSSILRDGSSRIAMARVQEVRKRREPISKMALKAKTS